jgi:hypothetical protein
MEQKLGLYTRELDEELAEESWVPRNVLRL